MATNKNRSLHTLGAMCIPQDTKADLRRRLQVCKLGEVPVILEEAEIIESEFRADLRHRYAELLIESRKAFLSDSGYTVRIAEDASALRVREENRDDPQGVTDLVLKLAGEGANVPEIARVARLNQQRVRDILNEAEIAPEKPEKTPTRAVDPREAFPEPRAVYVRYVEPRKPAVAPEPKSRKTFDPDFRCPPTHKHGSTTHCFRNHHCRCVDCISWEDARRRKKRERNLKI